MGYFFLLPPGLDSLSVALEPPGAGTRLAHEKVALRDSEPTLAVSWDISWTLPATQTGLLLPHSVPGPCPNWVTALGVGILRSLQFLCPHLHFP